MTLFYKDHCFIFAAHHDKYAVEKTIDDSEINLIGTQVANILKHLFIALSIYLKSR